MVWNHSLWLVLLVFQMHLSQKPVGLNCHVNVHFFLDGLIICWKIREDVPVHELCIWLGYDPYTDSFLSKSAFSYQIWNHIRNCQLVKLTPYELFSSALLKENTCSHSIQINTCRNTVIIFLRWIIEFFFVYCAIRVNNYRLLQV